MTITTRAKTPADVKMAIIAVLLWKKDTPPVEDGAEDEDEDGDGDGDDIMDWEARALVIVGTVSLEEAATMGAELIRGVLEGVEDVEDVEELEEGTEELAAGELVAEGPEPGVVLPLLNSLLSEMNS